MIDYILMNKKWINKALNCVACSSFEEVSSDHMIVTVKIHLSQRRNTTQTTKSTHYDWSLLNNRDISDKYTITVRNKFDAFKRCDNIPAALRTYHHLWTIPSWPVIHLVVPTGVSHFFTAQEIQPKEWEKKNKEQTNNKGFGQLKVQEGWFCDTAFPVHLQTNASVYF